jgi:phosphoribosylformylglycinamidine (FGAM) synthase-like amidotransferase family enzyme
MWGGQCQPITRQLHLNGRTHLTQNVQDTNIKVCTAHSEGTYMHELMRLCQKVKDLKIGYEYLDDKLQ